MRTWINWNSQSTFGAIYLPIFSPLFPGCVKIVCKKPQKLCVCGKMCYAPLRSLMSIPFCSSFIFGGGVRVARFDFHLANMSVIIEIFVDWIEVNVRVTLSFPIIVIPQSTCNFQSFSLQGIKKVDDTSFIQALFSWNRYKSFGKPKKDISKRSSILIGHISIGCTILPSVFKRFFHAILNPYHHQTKNGTSWMTYLCHHIFKE